MSIQFNYDSIGHHMNISPVSIVKSIVNTVSLQDRPWEEGRKWWIISNA